MKKKMDILYENKDLLIINKPAKLLTISKENKKEHTLYEEASSYVKKQYPKNKVFIVNRLDKDTSGIVVFSKKEEVKKELQDNWNQIAKVREYLAVVEGKVKPSKKTLKSFLKEDKTLKVYETKDKSGKLAITHYEVLASTKAYTLLKVRIDTGRKNQIRVQLSNMGYPIIGDKKYGSSKNPIGRLGLHASFLELEINHAPLKCFAKIPKEIKNMFESEIKKYEEQIQRESV